MTATQSRASTGTRFEEMHDIARHGLHVTEVLGVSAETVDSLRRYASTVHEKLMLAGALRREDAEQADEYMGFQLHILRNLKAQSESNDKRLENEISVG